MKSKLLAAVPLITVTACSSMPPEQPIKAPTSSASSLPDLPEQKSGLKNPTLSYKYDFSTMGPGQVIETMIEERRKMVLELGGGEKCRQLMNLDQNDELYKKLNISYDVRIKLLFIDILSIDDLRKFLDNSLTAEQFNENITEYAAAYSKLPAFNLEDLTDAEKSQIQALMIQIQSLTEACTIEILNVHANDEEMRAQSADII